MNNCFGMHGWKEFHRNRTDILCEYDRLLEMTENRPVRTAHGEGAEAYWRKWLRDFLPKRWAVTSGYIIPTLYTDSKKLLHYDVIIYDAINAPTLWVEGNEDDSAQGKSLAIPAKYVVCIMEIKSRLTVDNVVEMAYKLSEINEFSDQLAENYFSAGLFIQLQESDNVKMSILRKSHELRSAYGFSEAMVLRYEKDTTTTGVIGFHKSDKTESTNDRFTMLAKPIDELDIYMDMNGTVKIVECGGGVIAVASSNSTWSMTKTISAMHQDGEWVADITWSKSGFSVFCMDLLARLDGLTINDTNRLSFGRIFDNFIKMPDKAQKITKTEGMPYIVLSLGELDDGRMVRVVDTDQGCSISYVMILKNEGDVDAFLSDDHFANTVCISSGKSARKECHLTISNKNSDAKSLYNTLKNEGILLNIPIAYHLPGNKGEYYGIFKSVRVFRDKIQIEDNRELANKAVQRSP